MAKSEPKPELEDEPMAKRDNAIDKAIESLITPIGKSIKEELTPEEIKMEEEPVVLISSFEEMAEELETLGLAVEETE